MLSRYFTCISLLLVFLTIEISASIGDLKKAVESEPGNNRLLSELAHEYYTGGYYSDSIGTLKKIIKQDGETEKDILLLVRALIKKKSYREADFYYDILRNSYKGSKTGDYRIAVIMGNHFYGIRDLDNALEYFSDALVMNGDDPDTNLKMGIIHQSMGMDEKAVTYFNRCMSDDSRKLEGLIKSYLRLAEKAYRNGEKRKMIDYINAGVEISEKNEAAVSDDRYVLARFYYFSAQKTMELGDYDNTKELLYTLSEIDPDYVGLREMMIALADVYKKENELLKLAEVYSAAVSSGTPDRELLMAIAEYFASSEDWEAAYIYSRKADELWGNEQDRDLMEAVKHRYADFLKMLIHEGKAEDDDTKEAVNRRRLTLLEMREWRNSGLLSGKDIEAPYTVLASNEKFINKTSEVYSNLAEKFFSEGEFSQAAVSIRKAMDLNLHNRKAAGLFIRMHPTMVMERERILGEVERLLSDGRFEDALYLLEENGGIFSDKVKAEYADTIISEKSRREKSRKELWLRRGKAYFNAGKFITAKYYFKKADGLSPGDKNAQYYLKRIKRSMDIRVDELKKEYASISGEYSEGKKKNVLNTILLYRPNDRWAKAQGEVLGLKEKADADEKARKHYIEGIELYTAGKYNEAILEWENVEKYIRGYKKTHEYIQRAKKRLKYGE